MENLRFAIASKEGKAISEHFGHAKSFMIYELKDGAISFLENREVEHYCLGQTSSKTAMAGILEAVKDCHSVFVAKIGDGPTEKLQAIGVEAVSEHAWEEIDSALNSYAQAQGWL